MTVFHETKWSFVMDRALFPQLYFSEPPKPPAEKPVFTFAGYVQSITLISSKQPKKTLPDSVKTFLGSNVDAKCFEVRHSQFPFLLLLSFLHWNTFGTI